MHLVDAFQHEVLVLRSSDVPCAAIAAQVSHHELGCVNQVVKLVGVILVLRTLVHTVSHDHQRHV